MCTIKYCLRYIFIGRILIDFLTVSAFLLKFIKIDFRIFHWIKAMIIKHSKRQYFVELKYVIYLRMDLSSYSILQIRLRNQNLELIVYLLRRGQQLLNTKSGKVMVMAVMNLMAWWWWWWWGTWVFMIDIDDNDVCGNVLPEDVIVALIIVIITLKY